MLFNVAYGTIMMVSREVSHVTLHLHDQIHRDLIYFLEKTQDRMYEAGVRHPSVQQPRPRIRSPARSPARSPGQSGLQARRRINSQPDSIIDLT